MKGFAEKLEFEKAELIRKKIDFLENYQSKSVVANPRLSEMDVFSIVKHEEKCLYQLPDGAEWYDRTNKNNIDGELTWMKQKRRYLTFAVAQLRTTFNSKAKEIVAICN